MASEFRAGVLGFEWGTNLQTVARSFPEETVSPSIPATGDFVVERYHTVIDDTLILGVKRSQHAILFGFDRSDRLVQAIFAMPYNSKQELMTSAVSYFGSWRGTKVNGPTNVFYWDDGGVIFAIFDRRDKTSPSLFAVVHLKH